MPLLVVFAVTVFSMSITTYNGYLVKRDLSKNAWEYNSDSIKVVLKFKNDSCFRLIEQKIEHQILEDKFDCRFKSKKLILRGNHKKLVFYIQARDTNELIMKDHLVLRAYRRIK